MSGIGAGCGFGKIGAARCGNASERFAVVGRPSLNLLKANTMVKAGTKRKSKMAGEMICIWKISC